MKNLWRERAYLDLLAGPGRCVVEQTEEEFPGSRRAYRRGAPACRPRATARGAVRVDGGNHTRCHTRSEIIGIAGGLCRRAAGRTFATTPKTPLKHWRSWRKRLGVEPSPPAKRAATGFEDREGHRAPFASESAPRRQTLRDGTGDSTISRNPSVSLRSSSTICAPVSRSCCTL